jgi:chorismate dehydratase
LLAELCGVRPRWESLPIGCGLSSTDADAVLLIGDRAIISGEQGAGSGELDSYCDVWDLGERWCHWTGLPFVFAMWTARPDVDVSEVSAVLSAARDEGLRRLDEIAEREAAGLDISRELAIEYLRDTLHFTLGRDERAGLLRFYELCVKHGLAPAGVELAVDAAAKLKPVPR